MSTARVLKLEIQCGNHNIVSNPKLKGCLHEGRKILVPGRSQRADHPRAIMICFLYSDYTQRVVLVPSTRIFLAERQEDPSIAPCKLLSLGRSQYQGQLKMSASRSVANYGNKVLTISSGVVHEQIIVLIQLKGSDLRQ